ncbi:MAG: PfkB family carbohydrate kinase [Anaerolineae bacterium]|nr:PfkB family carbohydrate kinase [Anaerolineae bacterium]MDW8172289.1 PfkB family carbohydrate kinase [Anaerolineae bacterium]
MHERLLALLPRLPLGRLAVVGDALLDEYLLGEATRLSREAPIPVLELRQRRALGGGAANPALNAARLGADVHLLAIVGRDGHAQTLRASLDVAGLRLHAVESGARPTPHKLRILAHMGLRFPQQVARLDTLSRAPLDEDETRAVLDAWQVVAPQVDALLCSDYGCGMLTPRLVDALRASAGSKLLTADAQGALDKYQGFDLVKCNADDARAALGQALCSDDDFAQAAQALARRLALRGAMVITRGADGATLARVDGTVAHCPAPTIRDVYDTVGAGDTAIAVMTLALLAQAEAAEAVTLANYASGIVIQHVGNYAPSLEELRAALTQG